jgi:hypothetical protein
MRVVGRRSSVVGGRRSIDRTTVAFSLSTDNRKPTTENREPEAS